MKSFIAHPSFDFQNNTRNSPYSGRSHRENKYYRPFENGNLDITLKKVKRPF